MAVVGELQALNQHDEILEIVVPFLDTHPMDRYSPQLAALWGTILVGRDNFDELIAQANTWRGLHRDPVFEDALYYWPGLAYMLMTDYQAAVNEFDQVLNRFKGRGSAYQPDTTLRKGISHFYLEELDTAKATLTSYVDQFPKDSGLDQAYYFLAEIEAVAGNFELAIATFRKADEVTQGQGVHDAVAFRVGELYELLGLYNEMLEEFRRYVDTYAEKGRLSAALYQMGRAYEYLNMPCEMLELYRSSIDRFISVPNNKGVDELIEGYAEKYYANKNELDRTVQFLDQLDQDMEFRHLMVFDRGALFEEFYLNPDLKQTLYNELRAHDHFNEDVMEDLSLIDDLTAIYRDQHSRYPQTTPEAYFREQLEKYTAAGDRIAETRVLMGLYRSEIEVPPTEPYDAEFIVGLTPRVLLYIADYERLKDLDFAVEAWTDVLEHHADDDSAIVANMRLADVNVESGDLERALTYLKAIEESFPGSPQLPLVILRQGELLSDLGRGKQARDKYQYILRVPEWRGKMYARALLQTGDSFMAEGEYAKAHGFYERTFLGYPHYGKWCALAYLADADALVKLGDTTGAITTLKEALEQLEGVAPDELYQQLKIKESSL